jgi:hypothetical protein
LPVHVHVLMSLLNICILLLCVSSA